MRLAFVERPYEKRFILAVILVSILAYGFWTGSRYPALDEKAMMSGAIQLEDPISFEATWQVLPEFPLWKKIYYSTVNWIMTNRKGMTFGVLFGAAFLTLFGYLRTRSFKGRFANSAFGMVLGAPLGVCVNCAAPIARGLYTGGARAEATLSAMVASPTLNIVVLTMLFSIMPFYMAVTKVALSLFVILIAVPIICRFLPQEQLQIADPMRRFSGPKLPAGTESENIIQAVWQFTLNYAANLWFIIKMTVPLMLLAGFLGAVVATLLPAELLNDASFGILGVIAASIIGTFLPVPIAFDVVASGALLSGGLSHGYTMVLLFTLGIFSIYSFFIVATGISMRAASILGATIIVIGIIAGFWASSYQQWQTKRALEILTGFDLSFVSSANAQESGAFLQIPQNGDLLTVEKREHAPRSPAGETPFTRKEAWHFGIDKPVEFSMRDMWPPFWEGRSVSAGDIDADGDYDLVFASTEKGLYFYENDGSGQFTAVEFDIGKLSDEPVFNATLIDVDDDGLPDLFVTTFMGGNFIMENSGGRFDAANMYAVENREDAILTLATAFGDVDRDGDLDAALGNWAAGWYRRIPGEESRNRIIFNEGGRMSGASFAELPGLPGETLSILMSDINGDRNADLLVANDFEIPDYFYLGDGKGGFEPITRKDGIIPMTTTTTMAVKTADLHNDGTPEIYVAQIAGRSSGVSKILKMRSLDYYCEGIERDADRAICETNMTIKSWYKSGNNFDPTYAHKCQELEGKFQAECKGMLVKDLAIQNRDPAICGVMPKDQPRAKALCDIHFKPFTPPTQAQIDETVPQILRRNVLLQPKADGTYEEVAEAQGLDVGGWSWDTKIADFNNDGFQDVYIVNGTWVPNEVSPSNLFFLNNGEGGFAEESGPFGLEDYLITAAATTLDIDSDGDLDIITVPVNGPTIAFVNNSQTGNAIGFELADMKGNRFGIGAVVEIAMADGSRKTRELQLGGGFMSFDAPIAHFGIGDAPGVESVTVRWADGSESVIDKALDAGATYRIGRQELAAN
jgi:uncharacterized membrane protein YraQ (UPF0718 family)